MFVVNEEMCDWKVMRTRFLVRVAFWPKLIVHRVVQMKSAADATSHSGEIKDESSLA